MIPIFTGSYTADDVQFLLTPLTIAHTSIAEKEALIQSGEKHYSELLSHESLPSKTYLDLFHQALAMNQQQLARDILALAQQINNKKQGQITLVSLARAGTPIGVLLKHSLTQYFQRDVVHYSISILRDKGLDFHALRYIIERHTIESIIFVDGWTAKGVIAQELTHSLKQFAETDNIIIPAELAVLTDLCGVASMTASYRDYLIPSCLLNATVSGLISRTLYQTHGFHGCVYYQEFESDDFSRYFIDTLLAEIANQWHNNTEISYPNSIEKQIQKNKAETFIKQLCQQYAIGHVNYIKLGIAEATRVLLRRSARCLIVQKETPAVAHLCWLAQEKEIPIIIQADSPYQATALIQEIY
jgi:hypothetical protein